MTKFLNSKPGDIWLFRGKGFIAWAIRKATVGKVNHAAIQISKTELMEAHYRTGVQRKKIADLKCKTEDGVAASTVSIGLTTVSEQGEDMASLIRKADMGLFVAKESGFDTVKVSL